MQALPLLLLFLAACSSASTPSQGDGGAGGLSASQSGSAGSGGAGSTSSGTGSTAVDCTYPPQNNPADCPASYSFSYSGQPCPAEGLECWYPGAGDGDGQGCFYTAMLRCTSMFTDGGAAVWVGAM
jgi:hypothetical protein